MKKVQKFNEEKRQLDSDVQEGYRQLVRGLTTIDMENDDPEIKSFVRDMDKKLKELEKYIDNNYEWRY